MHSSAYEEQLVPDEAMEKDSDQTRLASMQSAKPMYLNIMKIVSRKQAG